MNRIQKWNNKIILFIIKFEFELLIFMYNVHILNEYPLRFRFIFQWLTGFVCALMKICDDYYMKILLKLEIINNNQWYVQCSCSILTLLIASTFQTKITSDFRLQFHICCLRPAALNYEAYSVGRMNIEQKLLLLLLSISVNWKCNNNETEIHLNIELLDFKPF